MKKSLSFYMIELKFFITKHKRNLIITALITTCLFLLYSVLLAHIDDEVITYSSPSVADIVAPICRRFHQQSSTKIITDKQKLAEIGIDKENDESYKNLASIFRLDVDVDNRNNEKSEHQDDSSTSTVLFYPVYSISCLGVDCSIVEKHFESLASSSVRVGHFIFILNLAGSTTGSSTPPASLLPEVKGLRNKLTKYAKAFPNRFILVTPPRRLSCAESWNTALRLSFECFSNADDVERHRHHHQEEEKENHHHVTHNVVPFLILINADFIITDQYHRRWIPWIQKQLTTSTSSGSDAWPLILRYQHFGCFAYTLNAWNKLGLFDEVHFPAYGEDTEFVLRAYSLQNYLNSQQNNQKEENEEGHDLKKSKNSKIQLYPFPSFQSLNHYSHVGSHSLRNVDVDEQVHRFDRTDYIVRKWGINNRRLQKRLPGGDWTSAENFQLDFQHNQPDEFRPHLHPFGVAGLSHRHGFHVDEEHRRCIISGRGRRLFSWDRSCYYDTERSVSEMVLKNMREKQKHDQNNHKHHDDDGDEEDITHEEREAVHKATSQLSFKQTSRFEAHFKDYFF